jgi:hypothetical protein
MTISSCNRMLHLDHIGTADVIHLYSGSNSGAA